MHPFYSTQIFRQLTETFPDAQICSYNPFLGIIPSEISDIYPASHNLMSRLDYKPDDFPSFIESMKSFLLQNRFGIITIVADKFMKKVAAQLIDHDKQDYQEQDDNNIKYMLAREKVVVEILDYDNNIVSKIR
jgi:7-cyano-7-deazaguanine tRNA-ribosyltransferase